MTQKKGKKMEKRRYTRTADQGNGTYINPILWGQYSDPSIMRDGDDYYLMSNYSTVYHSMDLVNWEYLYTLSPQTRAAGLEPWAPDLVKVGDTYYYYCYSEKGGMNLFVMTTKDIKNGPWSDPVIMGKAGQTPEGDELIDPALIIGPDGKRYLFMSKNYIYPLTDDGMALAGEAVRVLDDYEFPDDWDIEGVYTEGPHFTKRNGYYYLLIAAGGTMGPPTAHGVFSYRAKDPMGPWEESPYNPIVRCRSRKETWWTKGHASFIDTPDDEWYIIYHGILNGYINQGRMLLMEPIEWTDDGWFRIPEGQMPDQPLPMPKHGKWVQHGYPIDYDFTKKEFSPAWRAASDGTTFLSPDPSIAERFKDMKFTDEGLVIKGQGEFLHDTQPLVLEAGFKNFEVVTKLRISGDAGGGLTMYFNKWNCCGIQLRGDLVRVYDSHKPLLEKRFNMREWDSDTIYLKLRNFDQVVSPWYSSDGINWHKINVCAFIEPYNSHACYPSSCVSWIRPGIFAVGDGEVVFESFSMRELDENGDPV